MVDGLRQQYEGKVDFKLYAEVDATADVSRFSRAHGVSAIPTLVLVSADGRELERIVGGRDEASLRQMLDSAVSRQGR